MISVGSKSSHECKKSAAILPAINVNVIYAGSVVQTRIRATIQISEQNECNDLQLSGQNGEFRSDAQESSVTPSAKPFTPLPRTITFLW